MTTFTAEDRDRIRDTLLDAGRERFARYGYDKTTIGELTDDAGIARGTFYRFYDSKAALYLAVVDREAEQILAPIVQETLVQEEDPETAITSFLHALLEVIETNDLLQALLVDDEYETIRQQVSDEMMDQRRADSLEAIVPIVREWQSTDGFVDADPEVIAGVIRSVAFLPVHRAEIGERYDAVRDLFIQSVAAGLTGGH